MEHLLHISGVTGRSGVGSDGLTDQLSGAPMDLVAFDLKIRATDRDHAMGIAAGILRVLSQENERSKEIMKA